MITNSDAAHLAPKAFVTHREGIRKMQEFELYEAGAKPAPGSCLAPVGLSEDDCRDITGFVQSTAPGWQTDLQEDAFGQLGLIMTPYKSNRLQLALIAYRIGAVWFLDEVLGGTLRDAGEFQTLDELLHALGSRLEHCPAVPGRARSDRSG